MRLWRIPRKVGLSRRLVIADKGQNAIAGLFNAPLRKPDELYIVVIEPLGIFLAQRQAVNFKVVAGLLFGLSIIAPQKIADPLAGILPNGRNTADCPARPSPARLF